MPRLKRKWLQPPTFAEKVPAVSETKITAAFPNIEQAALSVTTWTIRRLIELSSAKIGKRFVVKREDLDNIWEKKADAA